ncbi:hypothetical protein DNTS_021192, partial [Danionella cerebrum]
MAGMELRVWKKLLLVLFFFAADGLRPVDDLRVRPFPFPVDEPTTEPVVVPVSGPFFLVTFPSVIESGSDSKLCASLLKPNESLTLTVSLLDDGGSTSQLVQKNSRTEFHLCFSFQAPRVDGDSIQRLRVEVQGKSFKMTEERKVLFRSYLPLTFIQTDKPLYNPGQTVNFRVVTLDVDLVPLDQMYSLVVVEDNNNIRVAQWTNVSSTNWILELSYDLNIEAQVGMYTLKAFIGDRMYSQVFEVKKYVLPKFDVTVNAPQTVSVGDLTLAVEVCAKYTYGQPVPGRALVQLCREPYPFIQDSGVTNICLKDTREMNATGCAAFTVSTTVFFNTNSERSLQDAFVLNVSATYFNGTPIVGRAVYVLDANQWPNKQLLSLVTDQNGVASFSLNSLNLARISLNLLASMTSSQTGDRYKTPYFSTDSRVVQLQTDSSSSQAFSDLTILTLDQPLKCGSTYSVTINYSIVGEIGAYSVDIVYVVLSRGVILQNGFKKVQGNADTSGSVAFTLTISVNMAPVVQVLVYAVLPSRNVVAAGTSFVIEPCFSNKVSLQFSPPQAVPSEGNVLTVSAQAGSLCGLSAVDQSVLIMEPGRRLTPQSAEGVERTFTQSWLLCAKGNVVSEAVSVEFPQNVVPGSSKCFVSVIGDIMGRALKNLESLLQLPSGCGEQNMIILAPNIYVLRYLEVTAQLTAAIRETAIGYLQTGYQGELNYRHSDGSFSTFGYDASNTWLTAFVLRSFALAQSYIFIDPNVLQSAKSWLIAQQSSGGCFTQQGTLYHMDMKGGVGDDVTMTGYIVASLLELGVPVTDPVIVNGLSCLRPLVGNLGNTYTTALLAYTFSLAGETSTRSQLLDTLSSSAISEGNKLHWSQTSGSDTLAVEISSYVLLAVLTAQPVTAANLGYANRIVSWLVTKQNPYGGFSSTQDTVVALHALALYATNAFNALGSSSVTVQSSMGGEAYSFAVNPGNRLLYQEKPLKNVPGKYTVNVKGSSCVSVQVACFYNIPTPTVAPRTLSVEVKVTGDCKAAVVTLTLNFTVKYSGPNPTTNMVLVDVKLLSGFTADTTLLGSPPNSFAPLVQRVDSEDDHVLVYLEKVPKGVPMSYSMQLKQAVVVQKLKPAVVNVYDYYKTTAQNAELLQAQENRESPTVGLLLMAGMELRVWKKLLLVLFFFAADGLRPVDDLRVRPFPFPVDEPTTEPVVVPVSGPFFLVTFPSVIESGSDSKLCASLLKPNESLTLTVSLLDDGGSTSQLVQKNSRTEFHLCFSFQAPRVDGDSIQRLRVEVQGKSFKMTEERKVLFRSYLPLTFIQTDKPLYNPGQTVNFRVVTLDVDLVPLDQMVRSADNNNIRVAQWTNVSSTNWILELSYDLNIEAQVGMYTLKAFIGDRMYSQVFEVKKYVLPKFDVTVNAPQTVSVGDLTLAVEVCAKYTYGQPVPGRALVQLCREPYPFIQDSGVTNICLKDTREMNATGCAVFTVSTTVFFNTNSERSLQDAFVLNVSATYFNGTPIVGRAVYVLDANQWPNKQLLSLVTDQNGVASFSLNSLNLARISLNLLASMTSSQTGDRYKTPYFSTDSRVVQLQTDSSSSQAFSDLTILTLDQPLKCGSTYSVTINYSIVGEIGAYSVDIVYVVLSRGVILQNGFKKVQGNADTSGSVAFTLTISVNMAPVVQVLVYAVLPSRNVVAAGTSFVIEPCFSNKVSLQFSPPQAVPSEGNVLTVSAQAGSLCGLSAVDQSVLIMEPGRRLTPQSVLNLLPVQALSGYPSGLEFQNCPYFGFGIPKRQTPGKQVYQTFKNLGMMVATNLAVRPPPCMWYPDVMFAMPLAAPSTELVRGEGTPSNQVTVRSYFPDTWIWQLAQVGASGSAKVPLTVPDTITTWETEAFCLSPKGFGLAPPAFLTAFQPFFLELTLPYSMVRGESLELKATVFNYLSQCLMVQVTPTPSTNFTLQSLTNSYSSCLCASGRKTFRWALSASVLGELIVTVSAQAVTSRVPCGSEAVVLPSRGRVDVVTRSLRVLAEGVERTFTQSWLLCAKGNVVSEAVSVEFPQNVVPGSSKCFVSVIGDIMGRALKNLESLLQLPSGCGEQNMIILAPNIYVLRYLEVTAQLTAAIRETAIGYLQTGYQGELNYRHSDGSFSTFGYDASNTWLTAFVLRSFALAQSYIFIDPNVLQSAKSWLIAQQSSGGCFTQQGTLYHMDMKGGVGDDVTMTGYIVASLLELGVPVTDPVIVNGLSCLRPLVGNLGNTYTTALLAYTFSLAGETSTRSQLLDTLSSSAISEGNKLHWSQTSGSDTLAVEISSYVLLAVLTAQPVTAANLGYANRIVSWLVTKQNPYGGFSSTQDTVVALHALALYATNAFNALGSSSVTVQSSMGGEAYSFAVNPGNRLLYQEKPLKNVPGKYTVNVKGSSCVSVQVACFYNIPTPTVAPRTLSVEVKVTGDCKAAVVTLTLNFTVKYSGPNPTTNMVLVDVKLLSGFTADTTLLGSPPNSFAPLVQRVDSEDDHVLVYLEKVPKGVAMSYSMQLKQAVVVQKLKPAVVNVYDYYKTSMTL